MELFIKGGNKVNARVGEDWEIVTLQYLVRIVQLEMSSKQFAI